jgi:hypothetical protein
MELSEIQRRLDGMPAAMNAKGKREPDATVFIHANAEPSVMLKWKRTAADSVAIYGSSDVTHFLTGVLPEILDNADRLIAGLPTPEEAMMAEFTAQLAKTIELGKANGIDVQFVNPLVEAMQRLSENAITDGRAKGVEFLP